MSLLALLPDAIAAGHAHSRTTQFIESFRRALKAGKVVAVECCVDLLEMAHASDDPASALVKFAGGMGPDLKVRLRQLDLAHLALVGPPREVQGH